MVSAGLAVLRDFQEKSKNMEPFYEDKGDCSKNVEAYENTKILVLYQPKKEIKEEVKCSSEINDLKNYYELKDSSILVKKLEEFEDIYQPLVETKKQIQNYFGKNLIEVSLNYETDPEYQKSGMFVIDITINLSAQEAFDIYNRFSNEWFVKNVFTKVRPIISLNLSSL